ncbi:outer membrane beta-barrel protein [Maribacter sp. TH_r10]|uniref:Outer membrane beta-barrel protein n=1 Tax=Maribacter luteus TaxID=2594478 RepID=A0A6I2MPP5_9FLAO|nr:MULTISPECIES: outer membrane beta-barrel protein [Maribacter]MDV7140364.1 outer membrane beta-barrel protein [Maribacter sp. TH_r10]MRX63166.1 outer membrane beta-barrel protein [Maribacter luteus]
MNTIKTLGMLLLFSCSTLLHAQSIEVALNLQPGLSRGAIDNAVYDNTTIPVSFAFRGGLEGTYFFNNTWGVRLGVNWLTTQYHEVGVFYNSPEEETVETTTVKYAIPVYYLSVPVQAVYKLSSENININLMAGMQYHFYLGSKDNDLYKAQQYPWYNKGYISSNIGVELNKAITNTLAVSVGLTADIPLSNFLKTNDGVVQLNNKNRLWQVFMPLKLTYQFKK